MKLTLSNLRSDYKLIYKVQPEASVKIGALIEMVKIDNEFSRPEFKVAKRIRLIALCQALEISLRTLYRWRRAYVLNGFVGLVRRKAPGKKAQELSEHQKYLIEQLRMKYKWGSEVIQAHLKYDHKIELSRYRIERFLTFSGLRDRYPCTTKKKKNKSKKEHKKVVKIYTPGEHTQLDTKHQPRLTRDGNKCYVYNFVDHASNWSFKRAYSSLNPKNTVDFIRKLLKECPFRIYRIQTDNGTEFTYKYLKRYADLKKEHPFEKLCREREIVHKLIIPGEKELQGLVERGHRQDDQELYSRINPYKVEEFNTFLTEYYNERNEGRRYKKLNWRTPNEWLWEYKLVTVAYLYHFTRNKNPDETLLPKVKNTDAPKVTSELTIQKNNKNISNCKDKEKIDEKINIKKAA